MRKVLTSFLLATLVLTLVGCTTKPTSTTCTITKNIGTDEIVYDYDKDGNITKYSLTYNSDVSGLSYDDDYYINIAKNYKIAVESKPGFSYEYSFDKPIFKEIMVMDATVGTVADGLWLRILPEGSPAKLTKEAITKILTDDGYACKDNK